MSFAQKFLMQTNGRLWLGDTALIHTTRPQNDISAFENYIAQGA